MFPLAVTSRVHHLLDFSVTLIEVAKLESVAVSVVSIHFASCSTSAAVLSSPCMLLPTVVRCHVFTASFLLSYDIALTPHLVTSWLVPILQTSLSGSARSQTKTSWWEDIVSSSSMTHMSRMRMSGVVDVRSMIEVIFLCVGFVNLSGSLFSIRWYVSTSCSSPSASLFSL